VCLNILSYAYVHLLVLLWCLATQGTVTDRSVVFLFALGDEAGYSTTFCKMFKVSGFEWEILGWK
jgi:hypothetical protein